MYPNIKNNLNTLLSELETISTVELRESYNVRWKLFLESLDQEDKKEALQAFLNQIKTNAQHVEAAIQNINATKAA
jgi:hypothetical protein